MENLIEQEQIGETNQPETNQPDAIHTDAEVELTKQVEEMKRQIEALRAENKKLFLRLGGDGGGEQSKTPDDEIRAMLERFVADGYNPNVLM